MERFKRMNYRRGSLTVEAAFVVPVTFMTLAALLIMTFYVHNYVWYTCAACEAAVVANMQGNDNPDTVRKAAEQAAEKRITDQVMPGTKPDLQVNVNKTKTQVQFSGQTYSMFNEELTPFQISVSVKKIRPESALRTARLGRRLVTGNAD